MKGDDPSGSSPPFPHDADDADVLAAARGRLQLKEVSVRQLVWGHVDAGAGRGVDRGHGVLRGHVTQRTIKLDKARN